MWTAWFLKGRGPGLDVVLLEQDICGGGPSGRNGGFLQGWWERIGDLVATFGEADALELLMVAGRSPAEVAAFCERNDIDAWFTPGGELAIASNDFQEAKLRRTLEAARHLGVEDEFEVLSAEA